MKNNIFYSGGGGHYEAPPYHLVNPYIQKTLSHINLDKVFVWADGIFLKDSNNRIYKDFTSQYGALPLGHNPLELCNSLTAFLKQKGPVFCQPSILAPASHLASYLLQRAGWGNGGYCAFGNSGAESVEIAIKLARCATGKKVIINIKDAFHGKTTGALTLTSNLAYSEPYHLNKDHVLTVPHNDHEYLSTILQAHLHEIAAVIVEPVLGEGGVRIHSDKMIVTLNKIIDDGILLIADEVQTGIGRLGDIFGSNVVGLTPNIICLSKALGGGLLPVAAVLYKDFPQAHTFHQTHSSTFAGNGLACTVALETLKIIDQSSFLENVRENGIWLLREINKIQEEFRDYIVDVRGVGMLLGIELTQTAPANASPLLAACIENGLLGYLITSYLMNVEEYRLMPSLNGGNTIRIQPPLNTERAVLEKFLLALHRTMEVLSCGEIGNIACAALEENSPRKLPEHVHKQRSFSIRERASQYDFAFIGHPIDHNSFKAVEQNLSLYPDHVLCSFQKLAAAEIESPFWIGNIKTKFADKELNGCFITPFEIKEMANTRARAMVEEAVTLAFKYNVSHIGLGAFTSVVTAGGASLNPSNKTITNGNSITAIAAIKKASALLGNGNSAVACCSIIGAYGSVGQKIALLAAGKFKSLKMIVSSRAGHQRASQLRSFIKLVCSSYQHFPFEMREDSLAFKIMSLNIHDWRMQNDTDILKISETVGLHCSDQLHVGLANSDVVFLAASEVKAYIDPMVISENTIVIDLARPLSLVDGENHKHFMYTRGGMVDFENSPDLTSFGIQENGIYGCLAETIMLCSERLQTEEARGLNASLSYMMKLQSLMDGANVRVT